jgi:hypothetical protein
MFTDSCPLWTSDQKLSSCIDLVLDINARIVSVRDIPKTAMILKIEIEVSPAEVKSATTDDTQLMV